MLKSLIRLVYGPLIRRLEAGQRAFSYQPSDRKILAAMGVLFTLLGLGAGAVSIAMEIWGGLFPAVVFVGLGSCSAATAIAGSDRAVATIWGKVEK